MKDLFLWIVLWTFLFIIVLQLDFLKPRTFDFKNRVISFIHSIISGVACFVYIVAFDWDVGTHNTLWESRILTMSFGYFIYDFVTILSHDFSLGKFDSAGFVHHITTLAGLAYTVITNKSGGELVAVLLLSEISNPFMHLIFAFKELKMKESEFVIVKYNKFIFAVIFFLARLVFGSYVLYLVLTTEGSNIIIKVSGIGLQAVSLYWFMLIVKSVQRSLSHAQSEA